MNTGSTDLRDTLVQQPNTAETLSLAISSRAFSAKSGQFEAGSTTTASIFLPSTPPFLFCSSMSMSMTSLSVVSEIAIVPESECRMPTLMVSCAEATVVASVPSANPPATAARESQPFHVIVIVSLGRCGHAPIRKARAKENPKKGSRACGLKLWASARFRGRLPAFCRTRCSPKRHSA